MLQKIVSLICLCLTLSIAFSQTPPCGNDYGTTTDENNIITQMRYGNETDAINAINQGKNSRGIALGCPQEVVIYQTPNFSEPSLSTIENNWLTVQKPTIEAFVFTCPRIGRYESNAALGAYYAMLAGYPLGLTMLQTIGSNMLDQQYTNATVTSPIAMHEGVFGYIHVGNLNPCYPGGVVGSSVETICNNAPSLCISYEFGQFVGEEFLVADQYDALNFYDGGIAYDHGWIGIHMIEAAIQQDDSVIKGIFKNAAVLATNWAINEYPVKNHNYTAKLIWLLAEMYAWSGLTIYKDALNEKINKSLIPGILWDSNTDGIVDGTSPGINFNSLYSVAQTPGRMWDGHNSLPWYQAMNTWAMVESYVAFRDQGELTRATELRPYAIAMLDNLANEIINLGALDPAYLGNRDVAYALLIGIWKIAQYENETTHSNWFDAAYAIWNSGTFDTYSTNSVCVGLYLCVKKNTPYVPLKDRQDFNSITSLENENLIEIYPNPSNDFLVISLKNYFGKNYTVELFNMQGKKIYSAETNESQVILDVRNIASGTYVLNIKYNGQAFVTEKIILN